MSPHDSEFARSLEFARACSADEIGPLLHSGNEQTLLALLENPQFEEAHLSSLLERKDLSPAILERIAGHKQWLSSRVVRRGLMVHPHTPRRIAMRLAREAYPMDLAALAVLPSAPAEIRRLADESLIAAIPQLPLGQKLALARRGSARVAGSLLADGHKAIAEAVLGNARLTEAQILRVLAVGKVSPAVLRAIACHPKWSQLPAIANALVRGPVTESGEIPGAPAPASHEVADPSRHDDSEKTDI